MRVFISQHLRYPEEGLKNKIEGTVSLTFTINYLGKVTEVKIISGLGYGCDEEAIRVVKLLKFSVSKTRKMKVKFHKNLNIHFRLPKQAPKPRKSQESSMQINYTYVSSDKANKPESPAKKSSGGYVYRIEY